MNWVCSGYFLPTGTCTCSMHFQLVKNKSLLKFNLQHNFRVPTCLPAYIPDWLHTFLLAYLPTCLPVYLPTCLSQFDWLPTCLSHVDWLPACLPAYLPTCLSQFDWLPTCLPAYLSLTDWLPACLPTYLSFYLPFVSSQILCAFLAIFHQTIMLWLDTRSR